MQLDEVRRLLADLGAGLDDGLGEALADLMVSDDALVSPGYVGLAAFASVVGVFFAEELDAEGAGAVDEAELAVL